MRKRKATASPDSLHLGAALGRGALIGGATFILSVAIAAFALVSYAKSYLKSAAFREKVAGEISKSLKAKSELEPVRWEGSSAFTNRFRAAGYQNASFGFLEMSGFRAELDLSAAQFRRGVWKVPEIVVNQVDLDLAEKVKLAGPYPAPSDTGPSDAKALPKKGKTGLIASLIPNRIEVDSARISNFNLLWTEGDGRQSQAVGVQTVITPTQTQDAFHIEARGGSIHRPGQEKLDVDRVDLRIKDGGFYLSHALIRTQSGAELHAEGDILPGREGKRGTMLIRANVDHLQLEDVVKDSWTQKVRGDLRIDAKIEGDPAHLGEAKQSGTITIDKGVLETFPILETLATYTGSERFRRVALRDGAGAKFTRQGKRTVIENIDVQSDGLARLTGTIQIEDKVLSGQLRLGIIPGSMTWLPGAEQKVFLLPDSGYLWTDIVLSGTVDSPQNDLVPKLAAAGVNTVIDTIKNPAAVKESVEGAIGAGRDLLKGFLGN